MYVIKCRFLEMIKETGKIRLALIFFFSFKSFVSAIAIKLTTRKHLNSQCTFLFGFHSLKEPLEELID